MSIKEIFSVQIFFTLVSFFNCEYVPYYNGKNVTQYWLGYAEKHGQDSKSSYRFVLFNKSFDFIKHHNSLKNESFFLKLNSFAHLGDFEFDHMPAKCLYDTGTKTPYAQKLKFVDYPKFVDWRSTGAISAVQNNIERGSHWAVSVISAIEAHYFIINNKSINLSFQELIDCSKEYQDQDCVAGFPENGFLFVAESSIHLKSQYGSLNNGKCRKFHKKGMKILKHNFVKCCDLSLMSTIANKGPVVASINVNSKNFRFYGGGVYHEKDYNKRNFRLSALVVGYSIEGKYYIVQSSFGKDWGEDGYFRIKMDNNHCEIASNAIVPTI